MNRRQRRKSEAEQRHRKAHFNKLLQEAVPKLGERFQAEGCPRCFRRTVAPFVTVLDEQRRLVAVCPTCVERGDRVLGTSTPHGHPDIVADPGKEEDRRMFEASPDVAYGIREPFEGEVDMLRSAAGVLREVLHPGVGPADDRPANRIFVYQYQPGARARIPFWLPPGIGNDDTDALEALIASLITLAEYSRACAEDTARAVEAGPGGRTSDQAIQAAPVSVLAALGVMKDLDAWNKTGS
jgi:hypothetical protein